MRLRTVEKKGGIDKFLADAFEKDLSASAIYYKKLIKRKETTKSLIYLFFTFISYFFYQIR